MDHVERVNTQEEWRLGGGKKRRKNDVRMGLLCTREGGESMHEVVRE